MILVVDNQKDTLLTHFVNFGNEGGSHVTKKEGHGNIIGRVILENKIAEFGSLGDKI